MAASEQPTGSALRTRVARGSLWIGASSLVSKGGLSAVLLVLAAVLTPRELGVLAIGTLVVTLAMSVQDLGLADALVYRKQDAEEAARTALTLSLIGGAVSTAVVVGGASYIARFFSEPDARGVILALSGVLLLTVASLPPIALMTRRLEFRRRAVPQTVPGLVGGVLTVVMAVAGYGIASLVAGQLVGAVLTLVLAWVLGPRVRPGWDREHARELLGYSLPVLGSALASLGQLNIDYVLVGRLLSTAALGVYSLAFRLAFLPYLSFVQVVNGAAYPLYCRLDEPREVVQAFRRVLSVILLGSTLLSTGLVVFADSVVVLGDKWDPAVPVLRGLAVFTLLYGTQRAFAVCLKAVGRTDLLLTGSLLHLGLLTAGLLLALPAAGLAGVGVVQAACAGIVLLVNVVWLRRELPLRLRDLAPLLRAPLAGAAAMTAVGLLSLQVPGLTDPGAVLPAVVRGATAVLAFVAVVLLVDRDNVLRIRDVLAGRP